MTKIGIDLVYMPRLKKHLDDKAWLRKILTEHEYLEFLKLKTERRRLEYFCGRYAAKEAYSKAKGTGIGALGFHDFEVLTDSSGKPLANDAEISISHDYEYTIAMVLINEEI